MSWTAEDDEWSAFSEVGGMNWTVKDDEWFTSPRKVIPGPGAGRKIAAKYPRFDRCSSCGGSGLVNSVYDGSPVDCDECQGTGKVIARDERGRFLPWEFVSND